MNERRDKIVELASDLSLDATDWDLQITSDKQKYSGLFLAFSTGGLALIAARFDALMMNSWTLEVAITVLIVAMVFLLVACVFGTLHHYLTKEIIKKKRQQKTLILKQKCRLFFEENETTDFGDLAQGIWDRRHFDKADTQRWDDFEKEQKRYDKRSERMLLWQQILAGLGYLLLMISAIDSGSCI